MFVQLSLYFVDFNRVKKKWMIMMCQSTAWKVNVLTQDSIKALTTKVGIGNDISLPFD